MNGRWRVIIACALALSSGPGAAWAEVVDVVKSVGASGSIGAVASLNVSALNIGANTTASGITFGAVTLGATPWVVAPQYLRIQHQSNATNWAIRILTNNRSAFPTMAPKVLGDNGTTCTLQPSDPNFLTTPSCTDDPLGYGGLIGTAPTNPNDRVTLAWQVFKDPGATGPAAPSDVNVGGNFNSPWAFLADASDCPSTPTLPLNCKATPAPTIDKTIEFLRVSQGDPTSGFLKLHPDDGNRVDDGDVALYIAARFGGAAADTYATNIIVELYHF